MILVTGGTGLVGSHLIKHLIEKGEKVRALKRNSSNLKVFEKYLNAPHLAEQVEWAEGDVLDVFSIEDALKGVEQVYHAAAMVSFEKSAVDRMKKVNIEGTANVVNACLNGGIHKLCHVSSVAAIGRSKSDEVITEDSQWENDNSNSEYAKSKYAAEREVWRGIAEGLNAVIVNPSIILGPADWTSGSAKLFSNIYKGLKFYPVGVNAFVDVRDVAEIMVRLMQSPVSAERFILMSENLMYKEVFDAMAEKMNAEAPKYKVSPQMAEWIWRMDWLKRVLTGKSRVVTKETARTSSRRYRYSNKKVIEATGHHFRAVEEAIAYTTDIFKKCLQTQKS